MKFIKRSTSLLAAVGAVAGLVLACAGCGGGDDPKIALLLPGNQVTEYEAADRRAFEQSVEEACGSCEVFYSNAGVDMEKQARQAKAALSQGAEVLVLDPVDGQFADKVVEEAEAEGVPVVDYAERIPNSRPSAFVGFDFAKAGELQAEALARGLREMGHPKGPIVMVKGEPGNPDQHLFEEGAHRALRASRIEIAREYYTPFWYERYAKHDVQHALQLLGKHGIAGVYAETDSLAGGSIAALRSAGIDPTQVPTTGRNASQAALQRIEAGQQYMTVEEPVQRQAIAAAEVALALAKGDTPPTQTTVAFKGGAVEVPALLVVGRPIDRASFRS